MSRAVLLAASMLAASAASADTLSLRCPMVMAAAETLYEIDFGAKTVRITNLVTPIDYAAEIDARYVSWRTAAASFRLDRVSSELSTAASPQGPWEISSFCVRP
jgi:hypothetical protein